MKTKALVGILFLACILFLSSVSINSCQNKKEVPSAVRVTKTIQTDADYMGSASCASCHQRAFKDWEGSHHDMAMKPADSTSVLGDFNNTVFQHFDVTYTFFRENGEYFVNTLAEDGTYQDFKIFYTYGIHPLQQFLVKFPKGKIQCLTIAWDALKKEWFSLYPEDNHTFNDWMHWTGSAMNWNTMCSDCHSTNVQKNYIAEADSFNTTLTIINVSCEACHGPGREHIEAVEKYLDNPEEYKAEEHLYFTSADNHVLQVDQCARCHSRRTQLTNSYQHGDWFMDHYVPSLIGDDLYFADGQILEEDYVYASFVQSKMYQEEVECTDCHNPHSMELKFPGNLLCMQCHEREYDSPEHHFHPIETESAECISCHMTGRTYMGNDFRRDHSFRVPRPDQSVLYDTPNACTGCHEDATDEWAANKIVEWYGPERAPHFSDALTAGATRLPQAIPGLIQLMSDTTQPEIARATAVRYLSQIQDPQLPRYIAARLQDSDPLVKYTAINSLGQLPDDQLTDLISPLLTDSLRAIRTAVAGILVGMNIPDEMRQAYDEAHKEYRYSLEVRADFTGGQMELAQYYEKLEQWRMAEKAYQRAMDMDNLFQPARINLAYLYNRLGRNNEAMKLLKEVNQAEPDFGPAYYSLGLLYAEQQKWDSAAVYLETATTFDPYNERIYYNLGLAHQNNGKPLSAEKAFRNGLNVMPESEPLHYALAVLYYQQKMFAKAKQETRVLLQFNPQNQQYRQLANELNIN